MVKAVNFQGPCSVNQNSIIDFTSGGTGGLVRFFTILPVEKNLKGRAALQRAA